MPGNFGRFSVGPDGRFVPATPRPKFKLLADFAFEDPRGRLWKVPAGVEVDGASIPRIFWTLFGGPFEGNYIHASVVHDHFCVTRTRSAQSTHETFYLGMRANGVPDSTAKKMYCGGCHLRAAMASDVARSGRQPESRSSSSLPELDLDDPANARRPTGCSTTLPSPWMRAAALSCHLRRRHGRGVAREPAGRG